MSTDRELLELAAKLGMQVSVDLKKGCATALIDEGNSVPCEWFEWGRVRAAAEIGKAMP